MLKVMKKKLLVVITMLVVASGFIFTGSTSTKAKDNDVKYLGKYKLTAYCGCRKLLIYIFLSTLRRYLLLWKI